MMLIKRVEFRENVRAFFPQGESKLSVRTGCSNLKHFYTLKKLLDIVCFHFQAIPVKQCLTCIVVKKTYELLKEKRDRCSPSVYRPA